MSEKITIMQTILKNYKKIMCLLLTAGSVVAIIAFSVSGWQCGKMSKTAVDIKDLRK